MKIAVSIFISIFVINFARSVSKESYQCANPNNKLGLCISLYDCPTILKLFLNSPASLENESFLQKSYCENGFGTSPFVCCTNQNTFFNAPPIKKLQINENLKTEDSLLSTQQECSRESYLSIAVWPDWPFNEGQNCIGSIITDRHILSSGWCVNYAPSHVTYLGISQSSNFAIEKRITHEEYTNTLDSLWDHDIGILRLTTSIKFNMEIGPICLPSAVSGIKENEIEDIILFTQRNGQDVNLIRLGNLRETCEENNWKPHPNQIVRNVEVMSSQYSSMEYGAPLVIKYNGAWIIYGVYSFNAHSKTCPVFARVSDYENWIRNKIKG